MLFLFSHSASSSSSRALASFHSTLIFTLKDSGNNNKIDWETKFSASTAISIFEFELISIHRARTQAGGAKRTDERLVLVESAVSCP